MDILPTIPGYRIDKKIGEGLIADVYLGTQEDLDRKVAIKILVPELFEDPGMSERFLYEAKRVAQYIHPNIVNILEAGESTGIHYIVMEYLPYSLRNILNNQFNLNSLETNNDFLHRNQIDSSSNEKLDHLRILQILKQIAWALDYSHKEGTIHKDITPQSIRFRDDGTPVVTGFFMSRAIGTNDSLKKKGISFTSPHYISPEQALRKSLDPSSDIYSLGVILYEMLTGHPPYDDEEPMAIENQHIIEPVPQLAKGLELFQDLLNRMMAKNKLERIPSSLELVQIIDELLFKLPDNKKKSSLKDSTDALLDFDEPPAPKKKEKKEKPPRTAREMDKPRFTRSSRFSLNFKIILPIVGGLVVLALLLIIFTKPSQPPPPTPTPTSDTLYIESAQNFFRLKKYDLALDAINKAEQFKQTPDKRRQKDKLKREIIQQQDTLTFNDALKLNTIEALNSYLSRFPSGLHIDEANKKILLLSELKEKEELKKKLLASRKQLRSQYKDLSLEDVKIMLKRLKFFDKYYNREGSFTNYFEVTAVEKNKIITDYATGLIWYHSGSSEPLTFSNAQKWIDDLNKQKYFGYSDWRFPTLEELESLLENKESKDGLFIDPLFFPDQTYLWAGDSSEKTKRWAIDFYSGDVSRVDANTRVYVRPVRSMF